jgi:hypothetical protein
MDERIDINSRGVGLALRLAGAIVPLVLGMYAGQLVVEGTQQWRPAGLRGGVIRGPSAARRG